MDLEELKRMMEKLGAPQTHLDLKAMIKEVDEDGDNKISFREVISHRKFWSRTVNTKEETVVIFLFLSIAVFTDIP